MNVIWIIIVGMLYNSWFKDNAKFKQLFIYFYTSWDIFFLPTADEHTCLQYICKIGYDISFAWINKLMFAVDVGTVYFTCFSSQIFIDLWKLTWRKYHLLYAHVSQLITDDGK